MSATFATEIECGHHFIGDVNMAKYLVQQFHESEDEFHEFGGIQTLELTEDESSTLQAADGEVTWLQTRRGFFGLASEEPVEE
ncbi:hypothetical protein [Paraburkholderia bannensis]|uniref:hypothetical protein n=1 Tax=Paraburkholderia bannensis TaxID=765414 RepID=UPI002AC32A05|nr:hypothetical protein [Paraburkholderia bannensis]